MWSICTDGADLIAAGECDDGIGVRVVKGAGGDRVGAPLDRHVRLVDEVAVQDVVAGVAAVVTAGRGVVIGPGLAESRSAVVVAADPHGNLGYSGEHVDAGATVGTSARATNGRTS